MLRISWLRSSNINDIPYKVVPDFTRPNFPWTLNIFGTYGLFTQLLQH